MRLAFKMLLVLGIPFLMLIPTVGLVLCGLAVVCAGFQRFVRG